jgi:bifunctional non-homologous end joining protein LigD
VSGQSRGRSSADQLALPLEPDAGGGRLPERIQPMRASSADAPFDDDDYFFEPWWPGARMFAFVEGGRVRLQTEHLGNPLGTLPELRVIASQLLSDGVVLDGTLLVLDAEGRPDSDLLRRRLAEAGALGGSGAFVASDLLWIDGAPIVDQRFEQRRQRLGAVLRDGDLCVVSRGLRGEGMTLASAVASMGLEAVSARCMDGHWRPGDAGDDWLRLPVNETPAAETRPLLVLLQRLPLDSA